MGGIYSITNIINNKKYIGYTKNFKGRWSTHISELKANKHENSHLQRAFKKYTLSNFRFDILEECDIEELLPSKEHQWCSILNTHNREFGYNIRTTGHTLKVPMSQETKDKISLSNKNKKKTFKNGINPQKGKPKNLTEESRELMKLAKLGKKQSIESIEKRRQKRIGKKRNKQTCINISKGIKNLPPEILRNRIEKMQEGLKKPIIITNLLTNKILEFPSILEASKKLGIKNTSICNLLAGRSKYIRNFKNYEFKYRNYPHQIS